MCTNKISTPTKKGAMQVRSAFKRSDVNKYAVKFFDMSRVGAIFAM